MKNRFSIIIINEKTNANFTFNMSNIMIRSLLLLIFCSVIGVIYLCINKYYQIPYEKQESKLYFDQKNLMTIITTLRDQNIINDSLLLEFDLFFKNEEYNQIIPISKPVDGIITQGIITNKRNPHNGVDIAAPLKERVRATQDGLVVFSNKLDVLGNTVIIAHPNNYYSLYGHIYKSKVVEREFVKRDQHIGFVGDAKNGEGPHLHFEIWHNNVIIDPRNLIKEYKIKDVSIR